MTRVADRGPPDGRRVRLRRRRRGRDSADRASRRRRTRPFARSTTAALAALVSALPPGELRIRRRDLLSHLRVLEDAFAEATIVPCAFGMVLSSEEAVVDEFLEPRREELLGLLQRLDGYAQLNVRVAYDEDVVLQEIVAADPTIAQLREQTRGARTTPATACASGSASSWRRRSRTARERDARAHARAARSRRPPTSRGGAGRDVC